MKSRIINSITWISTVATLIVWFPVIAFAIIQIKGKLLLEDALSVGIIGGADGPTAVYTTTSVLLAGSGDWILLGGLLVVTIILWCLKIKRQKQ